MKISLSFRSFRQGWRRNLVWTVLPLLFLSACHIVPDTGRRSLSLIPLREEISLGASSFEEIKEQESISTDREKREMVERVGRRIAAVAERDMPGLDWEFVLFEDDAVNAFALPGGKVGVYTGLFRVARTEDELAVVMGHEVAHVTARHGNERMSQYLLVSAGGIALDTALRRQEEETRQMALMAYGAGATVGYILPFSRSAESEADELGLYYSARAGYDPREAPRFWERMAELSQGGSPPEWLSTHPSHGTRVRDLERIMPQAMRYYEEARGQR